MSHSAGMDPSICPLCGRPNACATAAGETDEPCWCTQVVMDPLVLDRIAPEQRGIVCVCAACAAGGLADLGAIAE